MFALITKTRAGYTLTIADASSLNAATYTQTFPISGKQEAREIARERGARLVVA
ncbi:MAG TPA: hypothetical protein VKB76_17460 [Ktedonobacterales bacterium]|nr:hypothetical protein [Ktedonobacterales bacterium]